LLLTAHEEALAEFARLELARDQDGALAVIKTVIDGARRDGA
jgi:hypothetical protein